MVESYNPEAKINEDSCFEVLYFCKLYQLMHESDEVKNVTNDLLQTLDIKEAGALAEQQQNYVVLDAYHSASTCFKRLREQMLIGDTEALDEPQKQLIDFIRRLNKSKEINKEVFSPSAKKEPVRIYIDGAFDLIHSGHYNAIRQAKQLGDILVLGVNSDAEILKNKGPPVLNCKERADILRACKWADEVYEDTEYTVTVETLDRYNCQYYAHGDDAVFDSEGNDICGMMQKQGRFKMFKRTEGVSTTDIVGKLLLLTKDYSFGRSRARSGSLDKPMRTSEFVTEVRKIQDEEVKNDAVSASPYNSMTKSLGQELTVAVPNSQFLATTRRIMHFSNNREPKPTDTVVYISGSFDLLHNGHIERLKKAKSLGDFLYVGVWSDDIVNFFRGANYPILSLHERVLMLLACKYVDDVVIGAPYQIAKDLIKSMNIKKVVHARSKEDQILEERRHIDPFQVAKELGIFEEFDIESDTTVESIAERVVKNREKYMAKYEKKKVTQDKYYTEEKQYVSEL